MVSTPAVGVPFSLPSFSPVVMLMPGSGDPLHGGGGGDEGKTHHHASNPSVSQCTKYNENDGMEDNKWTRSDGDDDENVGKWTADDGRSEVEEGGGREPNGDFCGHVKNRELEDEKEEVETEGGTCWKALFRGKRAHTVGPEYRIKAITDLGVRVLINDNEDDDDGTGMGCSGRGCKWTAGARCLSGSLDRLLERCSKTREKLLRPTVRYGHLKDTKGHEAKSASATELGTLTDGNNGDAEQGGGGGGARCILKQTGKCGTPPSGKRENNRKVSFEDHIIPSLGDDHFTGRCTNSIMRKFSVDVPLFSEAGGSDEGPDLEGKRTDDSLKLPSEFVRQRHRSRSFGDVWEHSSTFKKQMRDSYKTHLHRNKPREPDKTEGRTREAIATFEARIARAQSESDTAATSSSKGNVTYAPRVRGFWSKFSLRKSVSTFSGFLASFLPRLTTRKFSDTPSLSIHHEESEEGDTTQTNQKVMMDKDRNVVIDPTLSPKVEDDPERNKEGTSGKGSHILSSSVAGKYLPTSLSGFRDKGKNNEGFDDDEDVFCADNGEGDDFEYMQRSGWVKRRVTLLERQISTKMEEETIKTRSSVKRKLVSDKNVCDTEEERGGGKRERQGEETTTGGRRPRRKSIDTNKKTNNNNNTNNNKDTDDDSDTEVEEEVTEELGEIVTLRSRSRNDSTSVYRYSDRPTSLYRYSVVRPRTVIIGLGYVCIYIYIIFISY